MSGPPRAGRTRLDRLLGASLGGLVLGAVLHATGAASAGSATWTVTNGGGALLAATWVVIAVRHRDSGVDLLALLALLGTLVVGEPLAGAVITVMLLSGRVLEARAEARAAHDLSALVSRTPTAVRIHRDGAVTPASVDDVVVGDVLLVGPGEVVPVDGTLHGGPAVLDESSLTGEPIAVTRETGDAVLSGVVNAGPAFDLRATTTAADSTYAAIVRTVREAKAGSAPFVRMADRVALVFIPLALGVAVLAGVGAGSVRRAVAVLVVATPCPLILAAPVAVVAGLSRSARRGVVVKGGAALERLARGRVLLLDKTGTITAGRPAVADVASGRTVPGDEVLRLAASLDQASPHVLAASIVRAATDRGLRLSLPEEVVEEPGSGIRGRVDGRDVRVGKQAWVADAEPTAPTAPTAWSRALRRRAALEGATPVFVGVDGSCAGALLLDDPVRADAARMIESLRAGGIERVVMLTGDRPEVAEIVGALVGCDDVRAGQTPADKVAAVHEANRTGSTVMVGDGINDAAALATADVGVAISARGASASSEAADVVLTVDRIDRLADAMTIAQRAERIAWQSVLLGMGLSAAAMTLAAAGLLTATPGAVLQEAIDVAAIGSALRAARPGRTDLRRLTGDAATLTARFEHDHANLRPELETLRTAAAALGVDPRVGVAQARAASQFLRDDVLPHEDAEGEQLYPLLDEALGGRAPLSPMARTHLEIHQLARRLQRGLADIGERTADPDEVAELQQVLYGLYALLRLHFRLEEEHYFSLSDPAATPTATPTDAATLRAGSG